MPYKQAISILQRLNRAFPDVSIDVHQEPWVFSSVRSEICHMDTGNKQVCNLDKLPERDVQRIRLKSEKLMFIPLPEYMTSESAFYYTTSGEAIIDHKGANKGNAVKQASEFFNILLAQMIVFGDDINDIDMIKIVGTGVAMGNAIPRLKEIANYVTKINDDNSIALWIDKHLRQ